MLRDSLSLAWQLGLGALTLVAGLGSVGAFFSGEWATGLILISVAGVLGWALVRGLRGQHRSRPRS